VMLVFKLRRAVCLRKVRQVEATFQSSMSGNATYQELDYPKSRTCWESGY
jgi:hypothetical protein